MRYVLAILAAVALSGCAVHRGETGTSFTFGQAGVCSGEYDETPENWKCTGAYIHGGAVSDNAVGAVGAARRAAGTALGFQVP